MNMKEIRTNFVIVTLLLGAALVAWPARSAEKTRVLLVTGGHAFDTNEFFQVFKDNPDITFESATHPNAHIRLKPDAVGQFDVLVLYDMWQKIDADTQTNFVKLLESGKGLVVLHHAIANYNEWDQYAEIIGARYYLKPKTVNGVEKARSQFKHDVTFPVHISDPKHPVTRGLKDFEIRDETYNLFDVYPGVKPLLTTNEPTSGKTIGWARPYGKARVVYLQLGHDRFAYENPNFRRLVQQAIQWVAKRN